MFLIDNRNKYRNTAAKTKENSARLKSDIKKLITALGVSEAVYIFVKFTSIYIVLQSHTTYPYQAAILTTLLAWIFYIITANAMVKYQKMFKHNEAS
jgi:uncharacterized BrkB/YihY/UPF0761 family membrane protein